MCISNLLKQQLSISGKNNGIAYFFPCILLYFHRFFLLEINNCGLEACTDTGVCIEDIRGHYCLCDPGFTGANCELDIDDCLTNPCVHGKCEDNGTDSFVCMCFDGFEGEECDTQKEAPIGIILEGIIQNLILILSLFFGSCQVLSLFAYCY